jgi:hypothetical protein
MPRIIDSVLVYDDSPDQSTELDQRVPVAAVSLVSNRILKSSVAVPLFLA